MDAIDTFALLKGEQKETAQEVFNLLNGKTYRDAKIILNAVTSHIKFCARVTHLDTTDCARLQVSGV